MHDGPDWPSQGKSLDLQEEAKQENFQDQEEIENLSSQTPEIK